MPKEHQKHVEELEELIAQALDTHAKDMDDCFLSMLAFNIVEHLPVTFIAELAADRIEELAEASVKLGMDEDIDSARYEMAGGFYDLLCDVLGLTCECPCEEEGGE